VLICAWFNSQLWSDISRPESAALFSLHGRRDTAALRQVGSAVAQLHRSDLAAFRQNVLWLSAVKCKHASCCGAAAAGQRQ
jgi:hypothetical protein